MFGRRFKAVRPYAALHSALRFALDRAFTHTAEAHANQGNLGTFQESQLGYRLTYDHI